MSYSPRFNHYEHKMIDIQCDIEKLRADLEYHEQKIRMITNELDEKNEKNIMSIIKDLSKNSTIIMISHKNTTLEFCEEIYTLHDKMLTKS